MFLAGDKKDGLNVGVNHVVGLSYSAFVIKICTRTKPAYEEARSVLATEVNSQSTEGCNLNVRAIRERIAYDSFTAFEGEERLFCTIDTNGNNETIKQSKSTKRDVLMPKRKVIESDRKNSNTFYNIFS